MVLAQPEIRAQVEAGAIRFEPPLEDEQWRSASVDLRLGSRFTKLQAPCGIKFAPHAGLGQLGTFWRTMDLPPRNDFDQPSPRCVR